MAIPLDSTLTPEINNMTDTPKTLLEAVRYFTDPKVCFEHMLQAKWPLSNPVCPKCGSERVGVIRSRFVL